MAEVRRSVSINDTQLERLLRSRDGPVGRTMAGFASLATREVRGVARERLNHPTQRYLRGIRSRVREDLRVETRATAPHSAVIERGSRPHTIRPRKREALRFQVGGRVVFATRVEHPGTPAYNVLRDGIRRAGRRMG